MPTVNAQTPRSPNLDLWFTLLFALICSAVAVDIMYTRGWAYIYQKFAHESVLWACGHGMVRVQEVPSEFADFLRMWRPHLACDLLPEGPYLEAGIFSQIQPYLTWLAAFSWRSLGLYQTSLWPLVALLAGLYGASVFALSRLFLQRWLAVISAVVLVFSPAHTQMVVFLRDYSKAPFFIWALFFLILAMRLKSLRLSAGSAALAGAAIGVGYGFRVDLIVLLPIGALSLIISSVQHWRRPLYFVAPACALVLSTLLVAGPLMLRHDLGASGGSLVMQGAAQPFRSDLNLDPAGYSLAWVYSDELTLSEVAAAMRSDYPDWAQTEMSHRPGYDLSGASKYSSDYLFEWASLFAGDFATQGLKAGGWVLGFPTAISRLDLILKERISDAVFPFYERIGTQWLPYISGLGLYLLLWKRYQHSRFEALALFTLFALVTGYSGIQFSLRHFFHLEFIWIICVLSILQVGLDFRKGQTRAVYASFPSFVGCSVGVIICVFSVWGFLVYRQTSQVGTEIAKLVQGSRDEISTTQTLMSDGRLLIETPVPQSAKAVILQPDDSMVPTIALIGIQWDVRATAERLLLDVGGAACPRRNFELHTVYAHADNVWQTFDAVIQINWELARDSVSLLLPAFYRPTQHFSGFILPQSHAKCDVSVVRLTEQSRLPLILSAQLSGIGLQGSSYFGFGGFSTDTSQTSWISKDQKVASDVREAQKKTK